MWRSFSVVLPVLLVLSGFALGPALGADPPPAKSPQELIKAISAAVNKQDMKTIQFYLAGGDARELVQVHEELALRVDPKQETTRTFAVSGKDGLKLYWPLAGHNTRKGELRD